MTEDPIGNDRAHSEAFSEWLENVAASEGISEQEALDRMMSSYWILHELTGLVEDSSNTDDQPKGIADSGTEPTSNTGSSDTEGSNLDKEDLQGFLEFAEILDKVSAFEDSQKTKGSEESIDRLNSEIDRIRDDIERLTTRIDSIVDSNQVRSGISQKSAVSTMDTATGDVSKEDVREISDRVEELSEQLSDLDSRQKDERRRVNENFGHIEDILQYLVGQVDALDERVDDATDRLATIGSEDIDREILAEIKRKANERDIDEATCEQCDDRVNLSLLERAECPKCGHPFDDLTFRESWFGLLTSHTLTLTSPERGEPEASSPGDTSDFSGRESTSSTDETPADLLADLSADTGGSGENPESDNTSSDFMWNVDDE